MPLQASGGLILASRGLVMDMGVCIGLPRQAGPGHVWTPMGVCAHAYVHLDTPPSVPCVIGVERENMYTMRLHSRHPYAVFGMYISSRHAHLFFVFFLSFFLHDSPQFTRVSSSAILKGLLLANALMYASSSVICILRQHCLEEVTLGNQCHRAGHVGAVPLSTLLRDGGPIPDGLQADVGCP